MRFWLIGTAVWLAFWGWFWSDCSVAAPGWGWDIACPAGAPVYMFSWGGFAAFFAETSLLPPAVALLAFLFIRRIVRRSRKA
jgi:hypothetical protein